MPLQNLIKAASLQLLSQEWWVLGDGDAQVSRISTKMEEGPPIDGDPPSPPKITPEAMIDPYEGDGWPSFVPGILRFNKGDVITVVLALGFSYFLRW